MTEQTVTEFDQAVAVAAGSEPDTFTAHLGAGWRIGGGINGGILLAVLGRALRETLGADGGHRDPLSVSAYYQSASVAGPATVRTTSVRRGRSASTGTAILTQEGPDGAPVERVRALATYVDHDTLPDTVETTAQPPAMPGPEDCVPASMAPPEFVANASFLERFDFRLDPSYVGWAVGQPSGEGRIQGWLKMADGREPDPLLLLLAVDALPPVTFDLGRPGWAPTVELTAHVRARPAPGWLRVSHATRNVAHGYFEEDAEVWDSEGRLVAQSRQLAMLPR